MLHLAIMSQTEPEKSAPGLPAKLDKVVYILALVTIIIMVFACVADFYVARNIPTEKPPTATITRTRYPTGTPTITLTPQFAQRRLMPAIPELQAAEVLTPLMERGFTCSGYEPGEDSVYAANCFYEFEGLTLKADLAGFSAKQVDTILLDVRSESELDSKLVIDYFSFIAAIPLLAEIEITVTPTMQMPKTSTPPVPGQETTPLPTLAAPTPQSTASPATQEQLIADLKGWFAPMTSAESLRQTLLINGLYLDLTREGVQATLRIGHPIDLR